MTADTRYWAALKRDEIGGELSKRVSDWEKFTKTSPAFRRMIKCHDAYYGFNNGEHASSEISEAGEQGELSLIKINHLFIYQFIFWNSIINIRISWIEIIKPFKFTIL